LVGQTLSIFSAVIFLQLGHLRSKRRMRRSRHFSEHGHSRGQIVDAVSIRERPAEAEDRAIPGHWEGDLLSGAKNSYITTLVERHSRFAMLIKVRSKETDAVVAALSQHVRKLPSALKRSLTWDRGLEMAKHKDFTVATDVQVYFCDPQSPWKRGTKRKHQSPPTAILSPRHRSVWLLSTAARPSLAALESTTQKDFRIPDSRR
jgi:IS30 family transposase